MNKAVRKDVSLHESARATNITVDRQMPSKCPLTIHGNRCTAPRRPRRRCRGVQIIVIQLLWLLQLAACGGGSTPAPTTYTVSANAGTGGTIGPASASVNQGSATSFNVASDVDYVIGSVTGCGGTLASSSTPTTATYTTGPVTANCTVTASFITRPATSAIMGLSFVKVKTFRFSWTDVNDATYYRVLENADGGSGFSQVGGDIGQGVQQYDHEVPLHARINAEYILQSCNGAGCTDSSVVAVAQNLGDSTGYVKASNTEAADLFGHSVALSGDGSTLAVGARNEASNASGVNGDESDNTAIGAGAVYVYTRCGVSWCQQAYVKASNADAGDLFGWAVSLSDDGNTLAVSALGEDSNATDIDDDQSDNSALNSGAVYLFARDSGSWSQRRYFKASNTDADDGFGYSVSLSSDGNTLAVGAPVESSNVTGVNNGGQDDNSAPTSGAAYVFFRSSTLGWRQQAYVKASNTDAQDAFGRSISLSDDGNTLAVGATGEASSATGVYAASPFNGVESDNSSPFSGAVYVFSRSAFGTSGGTWSQGFYIKASNSDDDDNFGVTVALSGDAATLAIGAQFESSNATGIDGDATDNSAFGSGAVYVFSQGANSWTQQAYVKPSNTDANDGFGRAIGINRDGSQLVVGAPDERSGAIGINGDQSDNASGRPGAVYTFNRNGSAWFQQAYLKASNRGAARASDAFGFSVSISDDGDILSVGAAGEDSSAVGVNGDELDDSAILAGAAYLY